MKRPFKRHLLRSTGIAAAFFLTASACAAPVLVSIGSDQQGIGRVFSPIDPAGPQTTLGDGSVAYNGGLTYRAVDSLVYAITNDSFGNSSLVSFGAGTPTTTVSHVSIGSGFFMGGLAANTSNGLLYAIASDNAAQSTLYSLATNGTATALGILGFGYFGGLTFDAKNGRLYAVSGDNNGTQRQFEQIDVSGAAPVVKSLFYLGSGDIGFNGGLAYDVKADAFDVIGNDGNGASALYALNFAGTLTKLATPLGFGYDNAGLAFIEAPVKGGGGNPGNPGGGTVPEPTTGLLALSALAAAGVTRRRRSNVTRS